tara:strand:- start:3747 stop:4220 length:474 start_codon:yes stop_codon:yes gene_type:complete
MNSNEEDYRIGKADQEMFLELFNNKFTEKLIEYPSKYAPIDFVLIEGGLDGKSFGKDVIGFVEYKNRKIRKDQYKYILIDHNKMKKLREHKQSSNKMSYLIITYLDGTFVYEVTGQVFDIEYGGRTTKTRNQYDIKVVEKIPSKNFKHINDVFKENQ